MLGKDEHLLELGLYFLVDRHVTKETIIINLSYNNVGMHFCAQKHILDMHMWGLVLEFKMWKHFDTKQKSKSFTLCDCV